jgi:GT2 family glycosyltransferase
MITIVLTNRNREHHIIEKCLISLNNQTNKGFQCAIVDYGSRPDKVKHLEKLTSQYVHFKLITCKTSKQLWNKSRAINIVLKKCRTPYFFVGDIDMIYHPEFVERLYSFKKERQSIYFQVGFLGESESKKIKTFFDYDVSFKSSKEATGMTLYKTEELRSINGYDEFYNGWGSEDTDTHVRLRNANNNIVFYDKELLILHQWHPKVYRQKNGPVPFHSNLEMINQKYLEYTKQTLNSLANTKYGWGQYDEKDYGLLENPEIKFTSSNELVDFKGLLNNVLLSVEGKVVMISITPHKDYRSLYWVAKKLLGKKVKKFRGMQQVNDMLLESIIVNCRNSAYKYNFCPNSQEITLVIKL